MMDAIAAVVEQAEDAFFTTSGTTGRDHRFLLYIAARVAWAKAALAADPTYFNEYIVHILALGYLNRGRFEKRLKPPSKPTRS